MFNQLIRYKKIMDFLNSNGRINKILEIGSGQQGLCKFYNKKIIGIDINFKDYSNKDININKNLIPIKGDITKKTKFKKNEFDLVICVDVLEHIDSSKREAAIKEMIRITQKIYLTAPMGQNAKKADKILNIYFHIISNPPLWLTEHLTKGYPTYQEIEKILQKYKSIRFKKYYNENIYFHILIIILESLPITRNFMEFFSKKRYFQKLIPNLDFGKTYRGGFIIEKIND